MPILLSLAVASPALAQPFADETGSRFPNPNPAEYTYAVALGDIEGDGDLDIFFANANAYDKPKVGDAPHPSRLFVNDGSGVFTDETSNRLPLGPTYLRDADFVDIDSDGDLDVVCAGAYGHPPRALVNGGNGVFADETSSRFPVYDGWWGAAVAAGDVDMDGDLDLYLTNCGSKMFGPPGGQDRLWMNDGKGHFLDVTTTMLPQLVTRASVQVRMADVDNDGDLDVLVANRDVKSNLLLNDGTGRFTNASYLLPQDGQHTQEIEIGDLTGDGWVDLLVANGDPAGTTRELLLANGLYGSSEGFVDLTGLFMSGDANPKADDSDIELFDVDSDGDFDVIVGALQPGTERLLLNDGKGKLTVSSDAFVSPADATLDLEVGDLDGDGALDVVTAQGEAGDFANRALMNAGPPDTAAPKIGNIHIAGLLKGYLAPVPIVARITDACTSDSAPRLKEATVNGTKMAWAGGSLFRGLVGTGLVTAAMTVVIEAADYAGNKAKSEPVELSPRHPLDIHGDGKADDADLQLMVDHLVDKGGLGAEADIDGDGDVDLGDAQLLASGLGGFPILSRVHPTADGRHLLVGANFGAAPAVEVPGAKATVDASGPISALVSLDAAPGGAFVLSAGGEPSNPKEEAP